MTDGPLIVQSDKTLLLEVDHELAGDCRRAIAPFAGEVTEVGAAAGDQVALGATLFVVTPDDNPEPEQEA